MRRAAEMSLQDIEQLNKAGVYATGWRKGLSVRVFQSGAKSFVLRYRFGDTNCMRCLGEVGQISRATLESLTDKVLSAVEKNIDPFTYFNESKDIESSFKQCLQIEEDLSQVIPLVAKKNQQAKALLQQAIDLRKSGDHEQSFLVHNQAQAILAEMHGLLGKIVGDQPVLKVGVVDAINASQEEIHANQKQALSLKDAFDLFISYERQVQDIKMSKLAKDDSKEGEHSRIAEYKAMFTNHIFPITGDILIKEFELMGGLSQMLLKKQAEQPALAMKLKTLLRKFISWASAANLYDGAGFNLTLSTFVSPFSPIDPLADRRHNPCLDVNRVPELVCTLWDRNKEISRAFIFSILTCARSQAVRLARWDEFDLTNKIWHVPIEHDKSKTSNHLRTIVLSDEACDLLVYQKELHPNSSFVFIRDDGKALQKIAFSNEIESINRYCNRHQLEPFVDKLICDDDGNPRRITQHGTARSCFQTWATDDIYGNARVFSKTAVEMCLLHDRKDFYNGAYDRSIFFEERKAIMAAWGKFCCQSIPSGFKRFFLVSGN